MTSSRTDREARLKAALRENLRKRKVQDRSLDDGATDPAPGDSAPAQR
jgi:hypothetical protein